MRVESLRRNWEEPARVAKDTRTRGGLQVCLSDSVLHRLPPTDRRSFRRRRMRLEFLEGAGSLAVVFVDVHLFRRPIRSFFATTEHVFLSPADF